MLIGAAGGKSRYGWTILKDLVYDAFAKARPASGNGSLTNRRPA